MKKKKIVFFGLIVLGIIIIIILIGGMPLIRQIFLGEIMKPGRVTIYNVAVENKKVEISGDFILDSSIAFRKYKSRVEEGKLYLKIYGILVSNKYPYGNFNIILELESSDIEEIYLEDSEEERLIWSRKNGLKKEIKVEKKKG